MKRAKACKVCGKPRSKKHTYAFCEKHYEQYRRKVATAYRNRNRKQNAAMIALANEG